MKDIIEVMIADDHILMREGIKQLLEFDGNIRVIAEAGNGSECLEKLKVFHPDVLLLDINMPEINGMEVLKKVKADKVDSKILMLTVHNEVEYLIRALDIGVDGYIMKDSESSELKKAIYMILDGKRYIQPNLIPELNAKLASMDVERDKLRFLTKREKEVLVQVASGMSNKEIAINLDISERTVKNHISNIFKKIDVSDRTQAAVFAIKNNMVKV
ncbi:MAG: response regulator transcription factor [Lachnospiraceae bacterium]|nr:response regulator transcription factor [Lachnospiraceae bacterium]